ncbi:alpha/beta hydrolase [Lacibacter sp. MH-610]|uniref:alpha/beta hydrolase fold domain-containing protein n=1 Tax=Lacibacter sp. MH-610 TaxID=3020883 RepID=UPI003891292F
MFLTKRLLFSVYISCFIALLSCSSPSDKAADVAIQLNMHPDSIQKPQLEDLSYGVHNSQKLDVYLPDSSANNKMIILYVHGGAWYAGDKTEAVHWANYFQKAGYTFICMNYRLTHTDENFTHPAQMQDIDSALHFISAKSTEWSFNKDRLIIMGASAGAHLALLYAYRYNTDKKVKLAVSLCGISDLTDEKMLNADLGNINGGTMTTWYMGDTITNNLSRWKNASPLFQISKESVPTYLIHGKEDEIIPHQQSVKVHTRLQEYKIPAELRLLPRVTHDLLSIDLSSEFNSIHQFIELNIGSKTP